MASKDPTSNKPKFAVFANKVSRDRPLQKERAVEEHRATMLLSAPLCKEEQNIHCHCKMTSRGLLVYILDQAVRNKLNG